MFKIFSTYICGINIKNATLEVSGAVRPLYLTLCVKRLRYYLKLCLFPRPRSPRIGSAAARLLELRV